METCGAERKRHPCLRDTAVQRVASQSLRRASEQLDRPTVPGPGWPSQSHANGQTRTPILATWNLQTPIITTHH